MHSGNINNLFILLFSRSTKKFTVFWAKYRWIKFAQKIVSKSFKFIKKYALKLLLENNKKIYFFLLSFQPGAAQDALKTARPSCPRAHRPHPGRNLGLGRHSAARGPRTGFSESWAALGWNESRRRKFFLLFFRSNFKCIFWWIWMILT